MEKYRNFDHDILGLQNEVNKYQKSELKSPLTDTFSTQKDEINIISSKSIQKINFNKLLFVIPFVIFFLFLYFKPNFIMINNPYDKKINRINYGKLIFLTFILSGLIVAIKYSI